MDISQHIDSNTDIQINIENPKPEQPIEESNSPATAVRVSALKKPTKKVQEPVNNQDNLTVLETMQQVKFTLKKPTTIQEKKVANFEDK